jgi:hypothetical protein
MRDRHVRRAFVLFVVVSVVLAGGGLGAGVDAAATTQGVDIPVTVQHTFVGTAQDSDHAVVVTVTVAPSTDTGAIGNTSIRIKPSSAAFIAPRSISTSETTGGDQVVTQSGARPAEFQVARLDPGETVTLTFRLYPKALVPDGESLATIQVRTQFERNQRQASTTKTVAPVVDESELPFAVPPPISPLAAGGIGAALAALVVGGVAVALRRRHRTSLERILRQAKTSAVNVETRRAIDRALTRLGADGSSPASDEGTDPPRGRDDATRRDPEGTDGSESGSDEAVLIDFDD